MQFGVLFGLICKNVSQFGYDLWVWVSKLDAQLRSQLYIQNPLPKTLTLPPMSTPDHRKKPAPGRGGVEIPVGLSDEEARVRAIAEIVSAMAERSRRGETVDLNALKSAACRKYGLSRAPKLVEMIAAVPEADRAALLPRLRAKPVRTASGIAVVAVMSKPHRCPHIATTGNICVYCPGGPDSDFEYSTQSYTGYEPTSMRAIRAR